MSESWHPRKTEKDVAVARAGVAKYDRGWRYGAGTREHDHSEPGKGGEVLKPEQAIIGGRDFSSQSSVTVTVGSDYPTIQAALDDAPLWLKETTHNYIINVPDGDYSTEDLTVPTVLGEGDLVITGNETTPSNVTVGTIYVGACGATVTIEGVQFEDEGNQVRQSDENAAVVAEKSNWVILRDCNFNNTTTGVVSYETKEVEVDSVQFNGLTDGYRVKHNGVLIDYNSTDVTGTVDTYARATSGWVFIDTSHSLTINTQTAEVDSGRGFVRDINTKKVWGLSNTFPSYLEDDFLDDKFTNRRDKIVAKFINPSEPTSQDPYPLIGRYRPEWDSVTDITVSNGVVTFPGDGAWSVLREDYIDNFSTGTWEFWFRHASATPSSTDPPQIQFLLQDADNAFYVTLADDGTITLNKDVAGVASTLITGTYTVDTNIHRVMVTRDKDNNFELLVDGSSIGTVTDTFRPTLPASLRIASRMSTAWELHRIKIH